MAIKVTLGKEPQGESKPFPKLMVSTKNGTIVWFVHNEYGFVIKPGETDYFSSPPNGWKMLNFTDYNEPITIQNA